MSGRDESGKWPWNVKVWFLTRPNLRRVFSRRKLFFLCGDENLNFYNYRFKIYERCFHFRLVTCSMLKNFSSHEGWKRWHSLYYITLNYTPSGMIKLRPNFFNTIWSHYFVKVSVWNKKSKGQYVWTIKADRKRSRECSRQKTVTSSSTIPTILRTFIHYPLSAAQSLPLNTEWSTSSVACSPIIYRTQFDRS